MNTNSFLKKLAKYDGIKHLKTSLKKLAVPLADELVEKGIPQMVRMPARELTGLTPKGKKFVEDHLQGDITNWNWEGGEYVDSLGEEEKKKYNEAYAELNSYDKETMSNYKFYIQEKKEKEDKEYKMLYKFHQTPKYKEESVKYFQDFPVPVYVIPVFQGESGKGRAHFLEWEEASPILEQAGLNLAKVKRDLEENDGIVFLSKSLYLVADFFPSTWMLFHAFFDQSFIVDGFQDFYFDIISGYEDLLRSIYGTNDYQELDGIKITKEIANAITSKAGRPGGYLTRERTNQANLLAEMLAQAIVKGKCILNLESAKTPEAKERLKAIESWVNGLEIRERLIEKLKGNIIAVEVAVAPT